MSSQAGKKRLIVVGCGPKSLAICAKAKALRELFCDDVPDVIVIEKHCVGAHWCGTFGYTDGSPRLGTPPEKDIGFPYEPKYWEPKGDAVNARIQKLSWQNYKIHKREYSTWVDRGKPHPIHREWQAYLGWVEEEVFDKRLDATNLKPDDDAVSGNVLVCGEVIEIDVDDDGRWVITCERPGRGHETWRGDGLVITGPGDPIRLMDEPLGGDPRLFDGKSFWQRQQPFAPTNSVAVIGAGETAASVTVALLDELSDAGTIHVFNPYGAMYTRGESFTENRLFSEPSEWTRLTLRDRQHLITRTDRGVFSMQAQEILNCEERVKLSCGRVNKVYGTQRVLRVVQEYNGQRQEKPFDYVVVAMGFLPLSFSKLLEGRAAKQFFSALNVKGSDEILKNKAKRKEVDQWMDQHIRWDLSMEGIEPRLHLPFCAAVAQGPGFPNLSCLGLLADRVLLPYIDGGAQLQKLASKGLATIHV